jgi:hypothetical protein
MMDRTTVAFRSEVRTNALARVGSARGVGSHLGGHVVGRRGPTRDHRKRDDAQDAAPFRADRGPGELPAMKEFGAISKGERSTSG